MLLLTLDYDNTEIPVSSTFLFFYVMTKIWTITDQMYFI